MKDILIPLFPDWVSNVMTACLTFFFLLLWHYGRQVLRDLIEVFATPATLYFAIFIAFILFGIREHIPRLTIFIKSYIISYMSLKNLIYSLLAIMFEQIIDKILRRDIIGKKLTLVKILIIVSVLITTLFVSYKIPIYEKEKVIEEARKAKEEKVRLEAEAMLADNMPKANNGDARAQYNLGFYFNEYAHDKEQAFYWYRKSAENNFARSQFILGCHYSGKYGMYLPKVGAALVKEDYAKALYWHNRASENGYSDSDYELYCMYSEGIGVAINYRKAYMHLFTVKLSENKRGKRFYHQKELDKISKYLTKSQIRTEQKNAQKRFSRMKK